MGYNAVSTDPLYKHIPFTITHRSDISFGLFYDNLSNSWLDLGNEIDNYHTTYRRWQAEAGDIDYYLFTGRCVLDITKAFVRLTGKHSSVQNGVLGTAVPRCTIQMHRMLRIN